MALNLPIEITDDMLRILAGDIEDSNPDAEETAESVENWMRSNPERCRDLMLEGVHAELSAE